MEGNNHGKIGFSIAGFVAVIAFTVMWFMAMDANPSWEYGVDTLSEMGICSDAFAASLFNTACMVAGVLGIILALGKVSFQQNEGRASGFMLIAACVFLIGVGIFTKNFGNGNMHNLVAILFFICVTIAMAVSAIGDMKCDRRVYSSLTAALIVIVVCTGILTNLATVEAVAVACVLVWILMESVKLAMSKA